MTHRRGTAEQVAAAKALRERGYSMHRIGELLGFSHVAVRTWLRGDLKTPSPPAPRPKQKVMLPPVPDRVVGPATAAEIIRLHRKGLSRIEIAALTGAKYAEIERALG